MTEAELLDRVLDMVTRTAGPARTPAGAGHDTPLRQGGFWLDSIDLIELAVACEVEFGIAFEGETDLTEAAFRTPRTFADLIRGKIVR